MTAAHRLYTCPKSCHTRKPQKTPLPHLFVVCAHAAVCLDVHACPQLRLLALHGLSVCVATRAGWRAHVRVSPWTGCPPHRGCCPKAAQT
jgi:hypothetical protein